MTRGRTLKLFLVDGTPTGVITAQLGNWSGKAVVAPRTGLPALIAREEAARTGVYLLVGPDPEFPGRQRVYVGEGDNVRTRLRAHDADESKDFFTRVCLIVSKDENLTKAHGRYLESRLLAGIKRAGRARLANGTEPDFAGLPEDERADMEGFLDHIEVILPVLGFDVLQPAPVVIEQPVVGATQIEAEPAFEARIQGDGVLAIGSAMERSGEFVVLQGSKALKRETPGVPLSVAKRRAELIADGSLAEDTNAGLYRFAEDVSFGSASGASAAIAGRADNGRVTWRIKGSGQTYGDWRAARLAHAEQQGTADQ